MREHLHVLAGLVQTRGFQAGRDVRHVRAWTTDERACARVTLHETLNFAEGQSSRHRRLAYRQSHTADCPKSVHIRERLRGPTRVIDVDGGMWQMSLQSAASGNC